MTTSLEQKKVIACAELMGWKFQFVTDIGWCEALSPEGKKFTWWTPDEFGKFLKRAGLSELATSLDAIVPVVIKWCGEDDDRWFKFRDALEVGKPSMMVIQYYLFASASQIRDALLLAAGKMPVE